MADVLSRIEEDLVTATRARAPELATLRLIKAAFTNERIAKRVPAIEDGDALAVLRREFKRRQESASLYDVGGRPELAQAERAEAVVISRYLPKAPDSAAVLTAAKDLAASLNLSAPSGIGPLTKALQERFGGGLDGASASQAARAALKPAA